jgi:hypothetical protein
MTATAAITATAASNAAAASAVVLVMLPVLLVVTLCEMVCTVLYAFKTCHAVTAVSVFDLQSVVTYGHYCYQHSTVTDMCSFHCCNSAAHTRAIQLHDIILP